MMSKLQILCLIVLPIVYLVGFALSHGYWKAQCPTNDVMCRIDASDAAFVWPMSWLSVYGASLATKESQ